MARATRKEAREALGAALAVAMTTCEEVNDYFKAALSGKSPILNLRSRGTQGLAFTFQGLRPTYTFEVEVLVRRGNEGATPSSADDKLDEVAQQLFEFVEADDRNEMWESLDYADTPSLVLPVEIGKGIPYWLETTTLTMEVFSG